MWDKKGENLTYDWLNKLKELVYEKKELVCEDIRFDILGDPRKVPTKRVKLRCGRTGEVVATVKFHEKFADNLEKAYFEGSTASGYCPKSSGTHVVRKIRGPGTEGSNRMSSHSWATAIDFDAPNNPYKKGNVSAVEQNPEFIDAFEKYGFRWLGDGAGRNSVGDDMHFEIDLSKAFPSAVEFTGRRLGTKTLAGYNIDKLVKYAKSRAKACASMGYLTFGSTGDKVRKIKEKLIEKGYEEDLETEFTDATLQNVLDFQSKAGIRTDGCVGPQTAKALELDELISDFRRGATISQEELESLNIIRPDAPKGEAGEVAEVFVSTPDGKTIRAVLTPDELRIGGTLAWRNNNPGNLRLKTAWSDYGAVGRAYNFATFNTFEEGYAALKRYITRFGFNKDKHTIASFMRMYTPKTDVDDPASYAARIAKALNSDVNTPMNAFRGNDRALELFAKTIKRVEGSRPGKVVKRSRMQQVVE